MSHHKQSRGCHQQITGITTHTEIREISGSGSRTFSFGTQPGMASMGGSFSMMSSAEITNPIIKPALPYVGAIQGGIKPGMGVFFQGAVPAEAKSFTIHFQTGQADGSDITFHFNPRIGEKVYLNSFRNGSWEPEETVENNPFTKGAGFIMIFAISSEGYEVFVNNVKLCMFKHRFPVEKVSTLGIRGDVSFSICGLINDWKSSSFFKTQKAVQVTETTVSSVKPMRLEITNPIRSPALPYMGLIPGGIKPQMAVFFQGTVPANAKSFAINFQKGQAAGADIAFQFNSRIGDNIYLNSFRNGSWEKEETVSDNPFTSGSPLIMFIVIKPEGYEIFANGRRPFMFKHRIPVEKVSTLAISGDVSLSVCGFINTWDSSCLTEVMKMTGITGSWGSYTEEKKITITWSSISSMIPVMFEVSNPISNPVLPYVNKISGGIKHNMAVFFQGILPADATAFSINFKTGSSDADDTAFHYNPHIGEKVYLNSFRSGNWGKEETVSDNPFTKGTAFILFVVINPDGYEVYVNGLRHCMFKHRIPIEKVTTLAFNGTVSFSICGFLNNWSSSPCFKEVKKITETGGSALSLTPIMTELSHPVSRPALPYVGKIPIGVKQYIAIFFQGTIPADAKGFEINFCTGPSPGDDIAFHFNPRIGQVTALNSFKNGQWETEESAPDKPFTAGAPFYMVVVITSNGYEVYVNDQRHSTFNHRIPFEKVSTLNLTGDISFYVIGFIEMSYKRLESYLIGLPVSDRCYKSNDSV
ncbi:uncharacterized protein LOC134323515 [Trichomycterus rosablanca]|uniref:uncharacterized protein LOC134323515 n=1 Tax=Trichomycterus rosablanca TaxID=2290929 RepID=UPI002F35E215